ncbi:MULTISPECIES: serine O-acetyltransferase [unclassified Bifidobacterium]|uniref:serine O-acetyltransferase n=1 Tax=unclassified Bifidobacterium TaxID=2608897 RepID=UPI00112A86C1|nr:MULTISPECIES: hypothetical protein [unclassified Bifidobacterium]
MIKTLSDLRSFLDAEKKIYISSNPRTALIDYLVQVPSVRIWRYIKLLRKSEYYYNNSRKSIFHAIMYFFYRRRKNIYGTFLGIEIDENTCDIGLKIWHTGNVVVSGAAKIGKNCILHGGNCIGNTGLVGQFEAPVIGDNVDIGVGASIIGNVNIADSVRIGAGAVVLNSCDLPNSLLVGIPARVIKTY